VDVYVTGLGGDETTQIAAFRGLQQVVSTNYPKVEERRVIEAKFEMKAGALAAATKAIGFAGVFCKSADGHRVVQFRRDGFTLNQVGAYESADVLFAEVLDLWPRYCEALKPVAISKLAMRYINELAVPGRPGDDVNRFFLAVPRLPAEAPQSVSQMQTNLVLRDAGSRYVVKVIQNLAGTGGDVRYVLDIEAFLDGPLPVEGPLLPHLSALRDLKNRVFFSVLTDEALAPYGTVS